MIQEIINGCKESSGGHMQPAVDKIVDLSLKGNAAYKKNIIGHRCGIHPENRAKTGVDPFNAQNLT